jgi:hypothetical protein
MGVETGAYTASSVGISMPVFLLQPLVLFVEGGDCWLISRLPEMHPVQGLNGWGGRDRTSACRNQNPVPYRLATPQQGGSV